MTEKISNSRSAWKRRLPFVTFIIGLALMLYPILTDMWATYAAEQAISTMTAKAELEYDADREEQQVQADAYNALIAEREPSIPRKDVWEYERQLTWQTPYMGWLEIPSINVSIPVYHGTGDEVLANGAGHVKGSALPVGGENTNCSVSAHSGLQTARMFDDVRRLKPGDKACLHVLGVPYAYEVVDSEVVEPHQVEHLSAYSEEVSDMLTLVTCTPFGINSHRLLVHCKRIPYNPSDFETVPVTAYLNTRTVPLLLAGLAVVAFSMITGLGARLMWKARKRRKSQRLGDSLD